jgi:hypothetical protein
MRRLRQLRDDCPSPAPNGYSWGQNGANHPKHKRFTATRRILNEVVKPVRVLGGCCVWCAGLVEGAVTEHGPQDVEASSGQGQDGLGVVLWEVDSVFADAYTRWSVQTRFHGRSGSNAKASLVAAPVRSAAPVRRHPRLMSVPDQPECCR